MSKLDALKAKAAENDIGAEIVRMGDDTMDVLLNETEVIPENKPVAEPKKKPAAKKPEKAVTEETFKNLIQSSQKENSKKKIVSFSLTEQAEKNMEDLMEQFGYTNRSAFLTSMLQDLPDIIRAAKEK